MTTIVFRSGFVASDSRVTLDGDYIHPREVVKVWRCGDALFGIVGSAENMDTLKEWLEFGGPHAPDRPELEDTTLIEFCADGRIYEHHGKDGTMEVTPLAKDFYVWGSGRLIAYGALELGASAAEAVLIAAKYDPSTGGTVRELQVVEAAPHGDDF